MKVTNLQREKLTPVDRIRALEAAVFDDAPSVAADTKSTAPRPTNLLPGARVPSGSKV